MGYGEISLISSHKICSGQNFGFFAYILIYLVNTCHLVCIYGAYHILKLKINTLNANIASFSVICCVMLVSIILHINVLLHLQKSA